MFETIGAELGRRVLFDLRVVVLNALRGKVIAIGPEMDVKRMPAVV